MMNSCQLSDFSFQFRSKRTLEPVLRVNLARVGEVLEDKTAVEQMRLIQQLEDEDKQIIFRMVDKMLTSKKFKDFFQKNVAAL